MDVAESSCGLFQKLNQQSPTGTRKKSQKLLPICNLNHLPPKCKTDMFLWCHPSSGQHILLLHVNGFNFMLYDMYEGTSKSFWTGRLEQELQMVQLSATRCGCITILWVSLVSFVTIILWCFSVSVYCVYFIN